MSTQSRACREPSAPAQRAGCIDVAVERRFAVDVRLRGGDLVDVYDSGEGFACVLLADLSSKGALSVAHAGLLRATFRRAVRSDSSPSAVLASLNRLRFDFDDGCSEAFATVFVARVGGLAGSICYASGGHDTALVVASRTHVHLAQTGPVIGVMPDARYEDCLADFGSGAVLLLATDGFTECRRDRVPSEQFGTAGIVRALHARTPHSPKSACDAVGASADSFTGGVYRDDATLVAISSR
jgi:sigma-B regulation protein RsbU (phosphoserine phosphatase)